MNKLFNFVGGMILGAMAGAVAGLLIAPKPGTELRKELQHEIDDILDEARKASDAKRAELEDQLSQMRGEQ
jgi:gas vesicle protein